MRRHGHRHPPSSVIHRHRRGIRDRRAERAQVSDRRGTHLRVGINHMTTELAEQAGDKALPAPDPASDADDGF